MVEIHEKEFKMYYLTSIDMCQNNDLESELRHFFHRIHHIKRRLAEERSRLPLNRMQRSRCKSNLLQMQSMENEFHAISHTDDVKVLYRKIQQFVKLDHERLMWTFGMEKIKRSSLFITL